jgi:hypothetical protein
MKRGGGSQIQSMVDRRSAARLACIGALASMWCPTALADLKPAPGDRPATGSTRVTGALGARFIKPPATVPCETDRRTHVFPGAAITTAARRHGVGFIAASLLRPDRRYGVLNSTVLGRAGATGWHYSHLNAHPCGSTYEVRYTLRSSADSKALAHQTFTVRVRGG